ncbi:MAG: hypothetical protein COB04_16060 [Gammaproteobacteria bacterium]|nr:MAG: hypothetical protein COB04_16060 [Gammaproteobacteria bacterium]
MKKTSVTIKLEYPIEYGEETISEIVLKRPKGKHLRKLPAEMDMDDILLFAGELSDLTPAQIDELDAADITKIQEKISGFLERGQKTGKKPKG